ncbi:MAG: fructosamine kinase family protein [Balneola sp.]
MIPEHIKVTIEKNLDSKIISTRAQSGGDINQASVLTFQNGDSFFLKWNAAVPSTMFATEAKGLQLLSEANTDFVIPEVILSGKDFMLLSLIEPGVENSSSSFQFGVELAKLHKHTSTQFGLDHDNFIGKLRQKNTLHKTWKDFFVQERIEPQLKLGINSGKFPSSILSNIDKLHSTVEKLFPDEPPTLLHGDLWSGNYMYSENGTVSIYDLAVYYGHREMDIAMTRLFGGFSQEFYSGYNSEYPLSEGAEERITLCNLYPILVHANLFGDGYTRNALEIMKRFSL